MRRKTRQNQLVDFSTEEIAGKDDSFDECLRTFLDELRYKRRRADATISYYRQELSLLRDTLAKQLFKTHLRAITGAIIDDGYIRYRTDVTGVKHGTINAGLRAARAFFNWAEAERIIGRSPMRDIVIYSERPRPVETFSREQMFDILAQPDLQTFVGFRDFTIMLALLDTGVRVRELCDIKASDVRLDERQILIDGKGGEHRLVPFQADLAQTLRKYMQARGKSPCSRLFITVRDEPMNRDSVRKRIAKYGRLAGIEGVRCSPHTFRHTFAKMSVRNGANIFDLQAILGHKSLDMVRRYVNLFGDDVKRAHERFSPVENLNIRF